MPACMSESDQAALGSSLVGYRVTKLLPSSGGNDEMPAQSDEPEDMEVTEMDGCFHLCDGVITSEAPAGGDGTELQYTSSRHSVERKVCSSQLPTHS